MPIKVTSMPSSRSTKRKKKQFKFEDMWLSSPECENVVKEAWSNSMGMWNADDILIKIKKCGEDLQKWSGREFGNMTKRIKKGRERMVEIDGASPSVELVLERRRVCEEIDKLLLLEETIWRQRSRVLNLKEGDNNTIFFFT